MTDKDRSEKAIMNDQLVALSALPETLVKRANTGMAWQGNEMKAPIGSKITVTRDMVILQDARRVRFGTLGQADIDGVHRGIGIQVESKTQTGRQTDEQAKFQRAWERAGGVYVLARSPEEAVLQITSKVIDKLSTRE
jgi:hypothetical protein